MGSIPTIPTNTMTADNKDIKDWLSIAESEGAAFLIIGLDTHDYDNFPIFCKDASECLVKLEGLKDSGNRYDEVYDMNISIKAQLDEHRAMHIPKAP